MFEGSAHINKTITHHMSLTLKKAPSNIIGRSDMEGLTIIIPVPAAIIAAALTQAPTPAPPISLLPPNDRRPGRLIYHYHHYRKWKFTYSDQGLQ